MNSETKKRVRLHLQGVMEKLIKKRTVKEPFIESEVALQNPFGYSVVPVEVWKGAKFERSFVTTLGQGVFEQLGQIIAEGTGAFAKNQYDKKLTLTTFRTDTIDTIIKKQRAKPKKGEKKKIPDLSQELKDLGHVSLDNDKYGDIVVKSDLYICRKNGKEEYYSFKTVKPNLDQTAEAKKNLLLLRAGDSNCEAYFALPSNPAGEGNEYTKVHTVPNRLFDMSDERFVLIGSSLWNKIGEDENTYEELLEIFREVGEWSSKKIRKEYFEL
ncbi:TPA: TdeIII family type II restriction endonuclease [Bacillus thuringiensis]|nr:TdeIII family type II restriction endonuclease [Bacillus thuringiensis]HDX9518506.1 TdeIII family type II restriction endonuclease [Bacillus thuringiensis]